MLLKEKIVILGRGPGALKPPRVPLFAQPPDVCQCCQMGDLALFINYLFLRGVGLGD